MRSETLRLRLQRIADFRKPFIELVGSSPNSIEEAVNNAISRTGKTIRNTRWFEVAEIRGHLEDNKVVDWQVTVKVGFTLDR